MVMSVWFVFMAVVMGGGGNRLLDYASTDAYWKAKNVAVSVDAMIAELHMPAAQDISRQIVDLGSPNPQIRAAASKKIAELGEAILPQLEKAAVDVQGDPEVADSIKALRSDIVAATKPNAVRRLMAIRTLGELKKPEALPALRTALKSPQMFAPEYAERAIAAIEGKAYTPPKPTKEQRDADLWLLPGDVRFVTQSVAGASNVSIDGLLAQIPQAALGNQPHEKVKAEITQAVMMVAEQIGDVRLDHSTAALSGEIGPQGGYGCVVIRLQYDSKAARAALAKLQVLSRDVGGMQVFLPQPNVGLIFPSDERIIATIGANLEKLPLEAFAKALAAGKGELANVPEMKKLIESVDTTQPLWGVAKMTDSYRRAPILAPFDTITMVGKQNGATMDVQVNGEGTDKEKVAGAVGQVNAGLQMGINQMQQAAQDMPILAKFAKALEGIKCTSEDQKATLTASVEGDTTMMALPIIFGIRSQHVAPAAAERAVPPGQVQPVPPPPPTRVQEVPQ